MSRTITRWFILRWNGNKVLRSVLIVTSIVAFIVHQSFDFRNKIENNNKTDATLTKHVEQVNASPKIIEKEKTAYEDEKLYDIKLKQTLTQLNENPTIQNIDKFGPLTNDSIVIVIQVHTRINYLKYAIDSLSEISGIEDVLLIFSHDYFDDQINELIRGILFCKTVQIFFPYSTQIYTNSFPGQSPGDCPERINPEDALKMNCINALFPDQFGHYRNASITQIKLHWWWKANMVFDQLDIVGNFTGLVSFIEDDHYVSKDFVYMLKLIQQLCPESKIFSMGMHIQTLQNSMENKKNEVYESMSFSNLGVSFNRSVWQELVDCAEEFCFFDDYNWDFSLSETLKFCPHHKFLLATLKQSRVHHFGKCGMHHTEKFTSSQISSYIHMFKKYLESFIYFPKTIEVFRNSNTTSTISRHYGFGGWGDLRDHKLCIQMVKPNNV